MTDQPTQQPSLTPREERVLKLLSGAFNGRRYTIPEVARRLGLSEHQIVSILESAKGKRGDLEAW